jgi:hypothetical protein
VTNRPPFYDDEAVLLSWGESRKNGAWITLQVKEDLLPSLRGMKCGPEHGERFAVVIVGPLANDEHGQVAREGKAGDAPTGDDGVVSVGNSATSPATSKPKRTYNTPDGRMPPSQRAAILIHEDGFDEFAREHPSFEIRKATSPEHWLLMMCAVERKRDIGPQNGPFVAIEKNFHAWRQAKQLGAI